jgi:hypothetical protein
MRSALEEAGTSWEEIVWGRLPKDDMMPRRTRDDFPLKGWRVVHASSEPWATEVLILAAPSDVSLGRWVLVQLALGSDGWSLAMPASYLPVPVREMRRQGLRLEWAKPEFFMAEGSKPDIAVVLVNESAHDWNPTEEDRCHVQGMVLDDQSEGIGNGWYAYGLTDQLPALGPGHRTILPAFLNNPELDDLQSGHYQLLANLRALDLRVAGPATLTVTSRLLPSESVPVEGSSASASASGSGTAQPTARETTLEPPTLTSERFPGHHLKGLRP